MQEEMALEKHNGKKVTGKMAHFSAQEKIKKIIIIEKNKKIIIIEKNSTLFNVYSNYRYQYGFDYFTIMQQHKQKRSFFQTFVIIR